MLVNKRPLLIDVTLNASCVGAGRQSRLFKLKTAVRIVTVGALHYAFQHLVMERQIKLVLDLTMTAQTELRLAVSEQLHS